MSIHHYFKSKRRLRRHIQNILLYSSLSVIVHFTAQATPPLVHSWHLEELCQPIDDPYFEIKTVRDAQKSCHSDLALSNNWRQQQQAWHVIILDISISLESVQVRRLYQSRSSKIHQLPQLMPPDQACSYQKAVIVGDSYTWVIESWLILFSNALTSPHSQSLALAHPLYSTDWIRLWVDPKVLSEKKWTFSTFGRGPSLLPSLNPKTGLQACGTSLRPEPPDQKSSFLTWKINQPSQTLP